MLKLILTLASLTFSLSSQSAIVDMGIITRDTHTGLDWLDLTETAGRSFDDISTDLEEGGQYYGWRRATSDEAIQLWSSLGVEEPMKIWVDTPEYEHYKVAVNLLGNTFFAANPDTYDYGASGTTGSYVSVPNSAWTISTHHRIDRTSVINVGLRQGYGYTSIYYENPYTGSYLVKSSPVPIPGAIWLMSSALIGLAGIKRK